MSARDYDIVLYGAGGFTGRQTVAYFATHAPPGLRWAIAGRREHTLTAARDAAGDAARNVDILLADADDQPAIDRVVARTRVILNTAGPFALYGTPVVDACVRYGTHYVDITGETAWARDMITRYFGRAAADGTRIIPFCGFDSVPSDLGTFLLVRHLQRTLDVSAYEVRAYFQLRGDLNGGTVASLLNLLDTPQTAAANDPFLLDPVGPHSEEQRQRSRGLRRPIYDAELRAWVGPFFMAPVNTRVVRRSAALYAQWGQAYGDQFVYQEAMKYNAPLAPLKAYGATAGAGLLLTALRNRTSRRVVRPLLPNPGQGPSARAMQHGWFTCELMAHATDARVARGRIAYAGDPGNRATVCFVCESALALALDFDALPGGQTRGGVLTPATGLGDVLAKRLKNAGVTIDIGSEA